MFENLLLFFKVIIYCQKSTYLTYKYFFPSYKKFLNTTFIKHVQIDITSHEN